MSRTVLTGAPPGDTLIATRNSGMAGLTRRVIEKEDFAMDDSLKAAILNARAAALRAEVAGMEAENTHRIQCGNSVAYGDSSFNEAVINNGLGVNDIHRLVHLGEM